MSVTIFVDSILEARRTGVAVDPGAEPANHAEAYEAQRLTAERLGARVAGWKAADHPKIGPVAAPIFAGVSHGAGAAWAVTPGLGVEIEVALRLKRDLPRAPTAAPTSPPRSMAMRSASSSSAPA